MNRFIAFVLLLVCLSGCGGSGGNPTSTPHTLVLHQHHTGGSFSIASGDLVCVQLPCQETCWILEGAGCFPQLIQELPREHGTYCFRAGSPGRCTLRFKNQNRQVKFLIEVRPAR